MLADLDRSAQRAMYAEKEIESLREKLTEDNVSKHLQKRSSTMVTSFSSQFHIDHVS